MVLVIAGGLVADEIGDVLGRPDEQRVEPHRGHGVLPHVIAPDVFLRRHRKALMHQHRQAESAPGRPRRFLERHLLDVFGDVDDFTVDLKAHARSPSWSD